MTLPRTTPSQAGIDAAGLLAFLDTVERDHHGMHGLMVARHGQVVAEGWWAPYSSEGINLVYSCSKSFTATVIGRLVDAGRIRLSDPILDHLPWARLSTDRASLHPLWEDVHVEHCLSMTVGHDDDAWGRATAGAFGSDGSIALLDWLDLILTQSHPDHPPGTVFAYNQVATYLLARAIEHVTGESYLAVLRREVLDPIGIGPAGTHTDTDGHALGFSGVHVPTQALLRLAQLHLDEGRWGQEQVVSADWVRRARVPYGPPNRDPGSSPDWKQGYGFSFWNCRHGYRGDGAYGQYVIVLPEQDLAIGITAETPFMQPTLDALWTHVLPACDRPGSPEDDARLAERLADLTFDPTTPAIGAEAAPFPDTWSVTSCEPGHAGWSLELDNGSGRHRLLANETEWTRNEWVYLGWRLPLLTRARQADDGLVIDVLLDETPHRFSIVLPSEGAPSSTTEGTSSITWHCLPLMGSDPFGLVLPVRG